MQLLPMSPTVTKLYTAKRRFIATGIYLVANREVKNKRGDTIYEFVNEEAILAIISPVLTKCSLDITPITYLDMNGNTRLRVTLTHTTSGEFISSEVIIPEVDVEFFSGGGKDYMGAEQKKAGMVTYWFRMLMIKMLNIPVYNRKSNAPAPTQHLSNVSKKTKGKTEDEPKAKEPEKKEAKEEEVQVEEDAEQVLNGVSVLTRYLKLGYSSPLETRIKYLESKGVEVTRTGDIVTISLPKKRTDKFWNWVAKIGRMNSKFEAEAKKGGAK